MEELNNENINEEVMEKNAENFTEEVAAETDAEGTAVTEDAIEEAEISEDDESAEETDADATAEAESDDVETADDSKAEDVSENDEPAEDAAQADDAADSESEDSRAVTKPAHPEAALEAILFAYGNSVSSERLCEVLCLTEEELEEVVSNLEKQYAEEGRGINIVRLEDSFQLGTKAEYYDRLVKLAKHPKRYSLTDSVIETLSIVAYKQPVTKSEIEKIRGVSADHAINRLVEYELIEEVGRLEAPGKPLLFGTTEQFLRAFGVTSISELPEMSEDLKETFKAEAEQEALGGDNDDGDDTGIIVDI